MPKETTPNHAVKAQMSLVDATHAYAGAVPVIQSVEGSIDRRGCRWFPMCLVDHSPNSENVQIFTNESNAEMTAGYKASSSKSQMYAIVYRCVECL